MGHHSESLYQSEVDIQEEERAREAAEREETCRKLAEAFAPLDEALEQLESPVKDNDSTPGKQSGQIEDDYWDDEEQMLMLDTNDAERQVSRSPSKKVKLVRRSKENTPTAPTTV